MNIIQFLQVHGLVSKFFGVTALLPDLMKLCSLMHFFFFCKSFKHFKIIAPCEIMKERSSSRRFELPDNS
ncbi:MAG: hypothetical protein BWY77_00781 [bacterium ADurb.Bin431]|nr:MAG: hypothetical protein BWY77_00781 [bacterium ADurb.Bin431]